MERWYHVEVGIRLFSIFRSTMAVFVGSRVTEYHVRPFSMFVSRYLYLPVSLFPLIRLFHRFARPLSSRALLFSITFRGRNVSDCATPSDGPVTNKSSRVELSSGGFARVLAHPRTVSGGARARDGGGASR